MQPADLDSSTGEVERRILGIFGDSSSILEEGGGGGGGGKGFF